MHVFRVHCDIFKLLVLSNGPNPKDFNFTGVFRKCIFRLIY